MDTFERELIELKVERALTANGWNNTSSDEGLLMLFELLLKANAGCYNSHTEEGFMLSFPEYLTKGRKLSAKGSRFICKMAYASSNQKSISCILASKYRS